MLAYPAATRRILIDMLLDALYDKARCTRSQGSPPIRLLPSSTINLTFIDLIRQPVMNDSGEASHAFFLFLQYSGPCSSQEVQFRLVFNMNYFVMHACRGTASQNFLLRALRDR